MAPQGPYIESAQRVAFVPASTGPPPAMLGPPILAILTYYCACAICCGQWAGAPTKSGVWPEPGWTLACPPALTARRALLWIDGVGVRQCEDTGKAIKGRRIDVYVESHGEAIRRGRHRATTREIVAGGDRVHGRADGGPQRQGQGAARGQGGAAGASLPPRHAAHADARARGGESAAGEIGDRRRAKVSP